MHINVSKQKFIEKSKNIIAFIYHASISRLFNPFLASAPNLYTLKMLENHKFAGHIEKELSHEMC